MSPYYPTISKKGFLFFFSKSVSSYETCPPYFIFPQHYIDSCSQVSSLIDTSLKRYAPVNTDKRTVANWFFNKQPRLEMSHVQPRLCSQLVVVIIKSRLFWFLNIISRQLGRLFSFLQKSAQGYHLVRLPQFSGNFFRLFFHFLFCLFFIIKNALICLIITILLMFCE